MEKSSGREHSVSLMNRANMSLSGVTDVTEFSDCRVLLKTSMGGLCVKGKKLSISQLNTDAGTLDVNGEIQTIQYTGGSDGGFFAGLFK
ncbi:MAG: YabP/YqfC family sporulation protein [Firmicutes bacterium]|nr:YabP/YqfC family sporulation protein [Bacillota bacterium]